MSHTTITQLREEHVAAVAARVRARLGVKILTGVSASFTATHVHMESSPHEHTWEIEAWFELPGPADARICRASLDILCRQWEGKPLPDNIQSNEEIATAVATLVNCVEVTVWRRNERLGAKVLR